LRALETLSLSVSQSFRLNALPRLQSLTLCEAYRREQMSDRTPWHCVWESFQGARLHTLSMGSWLCGLKLADFQRLGRCTLKLPSLTSLSAWMTNAGGLMNVDLVLQQLLSLRLAVLRLCYAEDDDFGKMAAVTLTGLRLLSTWPLRELDFVGIHINAEEDATKSVVLRSLRKLRLFFGGREGKVAFCQMPALTELDVASLTRGAIRALQSSNQASALTLVRVRDFALADDDLRALLHIPSLRALSLRMNPRQVHLLHEASHQLQSLHLGGFSRRADADADDDDLMTTVLEQVSHLPRRILDAIVGLDLRATEEQWEKSQFMKFFDLDLPRLRYVSVLDQALPALKHADIRHLYIEVFQCGGDCDYFVGEARAFERDAQRASHMPQVDLNCLLSTGQIQHLHSEPLNDLADQTK
jgi:hypothetical protein